MTLDRYKLPGQALKGLTCTQHLGSMSHPFGMLVDGIEGLDPVVV